MTNQERQLTLAYRKANPNRSMNECFWDAKRTLHFRATLTATVKEHKRRSVAAKKAWKARKAASQ